VTSIKVTDVATALWTVLDTALSVEVLDGPWQTEMSVPVYVVVGHDDDPDTNEAVLADQIPSDLSRNMRQEIGAVNCVIVAASGGTDMAALRASAKQTFNDVGTTLAGNPTLGGVVQRAEYGTQFLLKQEANDDGITAKLLFSVGYTASV
jgi:hypothetical protein